MSERTIHAIDVILKKRDGLELSEGEIRAFIRGVVREEISPARIASWLMAVFQRGMTARELETLTDAMRGSGEVFSAAGLGRFTVDKHSTGGVGDKTSLLIAPICAAAGLAVPMISGRSLGHTGGTLDKMETIPGFNTQLSMREFYDVIAKCGACMIGQTPSLVPADRVLYALRDHTGTVESPTLITASIMSKKLAEDLRGLVLDVKVGSGAFMPSYQASRELAELMVGTGKAAGCKTVALLTSMDEPLGRFAGNWVEVWECVDVLKGKAHPLSAEMTSLSLTLSGWMIFLGRRAASAAEGRAVAQRVLEDGSAWRVWQQMVKLQGGSTAEFDDPGAFHKPAATRVLRAWRNGHVAGMDCKQVGWAVQRLGAGREMPGDPVSAGAGIEMHVKIGYYVSEGQPLVTMFADREEQLDDAERALRGTLRFSDAPVTPPWLVREVVGE